MSPKVTAVHTDTSANSVKIGPHMAAVCYSPTADKPPNALPVNCSSGVAPQKLDASGCTDPTVVSESTDDESDRIELHSPGDEQGLTTFWEVEEGQHQVTDVQG